MHPGSSKREEIETDDSTLENLQKYVPENLKQLLKKRQLYKGPITNIISNTKKGKWNCQRTGHIPWNNIDTNCRTSKILLYW